MVESKQSPKVVLWDLRDLVQTWILKESTTNLRNGRWKMMAEKSQNNLWQSMAGHSGGPTVHFPEVKGVRLKRD